jgi:hypothetical protein
MMAAPAQILTDMAMAALRAVLVGNLVRHVVLLRGSRLCRSDSHQKPRRRTHRYQTLRTSNVSPAASPNIV